MERLEFTISPTGLVTEKVSGVTGPSCKVVTEEINKLLGEVVATEDTAEVRGGGEMGCDGNIPYIVAEYDMRLALQ